MISHVALLAGSELQTTLSDEIAGEEGRSNGWDSFDEDDTKSQSNLWDE